MTAEQRSAFAYATRAGGKVRVITGFSGCRQDVPDRWDRRAAGYSSG
jgi:hypothetical protein